MGGDDLVLILFFILLGQLDRSLRPLGQRKRGRVGGVFQKVDTSTSALLLKTCLT